MFSCYIGVQNQNERPENNCNRSPLSSVYYKYGFTTASLSSDQVDLLLNITPYFNFFAVICVAVLIMLDLNVLDNFLSIPMTTLPDQSAC